MSNEGSGAASCSTADLSTTNDDEFSRAVLQRIEDGVHETLDVLDSGSNEMLRSLILPAHVPIIVGALVKARAHDPSSDHWSGMSRLASRSAAARFKLDAAAAASRGRENASDYDIAAASRGLCPAIQTLAAVRVMCASEHAASVAALPAPQLIPTGDSIGEKRARLALRKLRGLRDADTVAQRNMDDEGGRTGVSGHCEEKLSIDNADAAAAASEATSADCPSSAVE